MVGLLLMLPTALYLYFELSISIGLTIVMIGSWITIYYSDTTIYSFKKEYLKNASIPILLLLIHTLFVYILFGNEPNFLRILPSIGLFGILILTSFMFVKFVANTKEAHVFETVKILFYLLLTVGYLSVILIKYNLAPVYTKSMLFYSEPSHFSMVFIPIALAYLYFLDVKYKLLYILLLLILGILLPNLSLLVGTFIIMFCILEVKYLLAAVFTGITILILFPGNILDYISTRIHFFTVTSHDDNLSVLVYLSGLERGYLDFIHSYGLGIGFNNFGYMGPTGEYTAMAMQAMHGFLLCFNDGSFLFGKVLGELGIIGIILTLIYVYYLIKTLVIFKSSKLKKSKDIFFSSFFILFSSYMFVRGMGYFSPFTFMFTSSIYWYYLESSNRKRHE